MLPLITLKEGEKAIVLRFEDDGPEFARIRSFGLDINTEIMLITSQAAVQGPLLLSVNGGRYAVDYNLASRIFVQPLGG